ncbi:hypothetical protein BDZ94DRAFT_1261822 [Collybia nuda]|uniref:DUF6534 domain-containing protein n=1 Tax=Collybia nuda TaxID=64659 RepID=A0A9P5Y3Y2_9AGAR|nr:hypothetical protein BDZ94DRAFT_1261822 [Collybia nuda]
MVEIGAAMVDIPRTQGALLLGGLFSAGLSGIVAVQVVVYFKLYPLDVPIIKTLVVLIWLLDLVHTGFTWAAIWEYLIVYYGNAANSDIIPLSLSLTIVFTAILTFFVHCFFAHRIHLLSKKNWFLTCPIMLLAVCRLCSASATSAEMIRLQSFSIFKLQFRWLFSLGLALSSTVDIFVTLSLFALLQNSRSHSLTLDHVIDSLILYAFEIGSLTCAGTIVSMICWLTMNDNLIFMGLHFVIGKFYANSILATLNTRHELRRSQNSHDMTPQFEVDTQRPRQLQFRNPFDTEGHNIQLRPVHISVEKSVQLGYDTHQIPRTHSLSDQESSIWKDHSKTFDSK